MTSGFQKSYAFIVMFLLFFICQLNSKFCVENFAEPILMAFDLMHFYTGNFVSEDFNDSATIILVRMNVVDKIGLRIVKAFC